MVFIFITTLKSIKERSTLVHWFNDQVFKNPLVMAVQFSNEVREQWIEQQKKWGQ